MINQVFRAVKAVLGLIAKVISTIVNFVLLALVYIAGIGTVSIFMKLFGKHFLELKKQDKKSNWHERKASKQALEQYFKTF